MNPKDINGITVMDAKSVCHFQIKLARTIEIWTKSQSLAQPRSIMNTYDLIDHIKHIKRS